MKSEQILTVPLKSVRRDAHQPRQTFDAAKLQELADSICANGQRVPAEVRSLAKNDPDRKKGVEYEMISGERRHRACELGKVPTFRILISDVDDREKFKLQLIENQQRENLTALEEAGAYQQEIARRRTKDPKFGPEDLAKEIGQSRATVYERLKLTRLHAPVRAALLAGKISTSVAGLLAIIPEPARQELLLKHVTDEKQWNYPFSFRDVQETVEDEYCKPLAGAPFDRKTTYDGDVKLAGSTLMLHLRGPCTLCKYRTGNMAAEFPELAARPNVCTQPACYHGKVAAAAVLKLKTAAVAGKPTLSAAEFAKRKSDFVRGDKMESTLTRYDSWTALMGRHKPAPVLVAMPEGLMTVYPKEEAVKAAKKNGIKFYDQAKSRAREAQSQTDRTKAEAAQKALRESRETLTRACLPQLAKGLSKLADKQAWLLIAAMVAQYVQGHRFGLKGKTDKEIVLARLFNEDSPVNWDGQWDKKVSFFWKLAGVDLSAEEQKSKAKFDPQNNKQFKERLDRMAPIKKPKGKTKAARQRRSTKKGK